MQSGSFGLLISIIFLLIIPENSTSASSSVKKDGPTAITGEKKVKKPCIPCHLVAGSIKAISSLMSDLQLISEAHCSSEHSHEIKDDYEESRGARAFIPMRPNPHHIYYQPQLMHHPVGMGNKMNYGQQRQNGYIMPGSRHQHHYFNYNFPRQTTRFTQPGPAQQPLVHPQLSSLPPTTTPGNTIISNSPHDSTTGMNLLQERSVNDAQQKKKKKKKKMCSRKKSKKQIKLSNQKEANRTGDVNSGDDNDDDDGDEYNEDSNDKIKSNGTTTANYHESILPLSRGNSGNYKNNYTRNPAGV